MNIEELPDLCLRLPAVTEDIKWEDIIQASHFARRQWMTVMEESRFNRAEWEFYILQSYELVKSKLARKVREQIAPFPGFETNPL